MNEDKPLAKHQARDPVDSAKERVATHSAAITGGAIAGAAAGAASGIAFGPVGSVVGAVTGALAGAAGGSATGAGEAVDTLAFEAYWRDRFAERPYAAPSARYDDYAPAYRFGIRHYVQTDHPKTWDEVRDHLGVAWMQERESSLSWHDAMPAVRDAWQQMLDPEGFR